MNSEDKVKTILQLRDARELLEVKDLMLNQITKGTACIINLFNSKVFNEEELSMLKEEIFSIILNSEMKEMWSDEEISEKIKNTIQFFIDKKYDAIGESGFKALMHLLEFDKEDIEDGIEKFYVFFQDKVNSILSKKGIDISSKQSLLYSDTDISFIIYEDKELYAFEIAWQEITDGIK